MSYSANKSIDQAFCALKRAHKNEKGPHTDVNKKQEKDKKHYKTMP